MKERIEWELVKPDGVVQSKPHNLNPHPEVLGGKTVLLRWNGKHNGDIFLNRLAELLTHAVKNVRIIKSWDVAPETATSSHNPDRSGEFARKLADLKPDITWHMVGHLRRSKGNDARVLFDIIHSIDSVKLAQILNQRAHKTMSVLLQVNISGEIPKSGFAVNEVANAFREIKQLQNLQVIGLMTIAPLTDDVEDVRPVFRKLWELRDSLGLKHLSMGMTDDFEVAIEEGATMVRIGRAIFGDRRL